MNYVSVILCCNEMVATKKSFIILFAMYRGVEVINSVKKYMIVDLLVLAVIGFILEFLCVKFSGTVLYAAPSVTIALLIAFIAIARWNLWGLLICPILALATLWGGTKIEVSYMSAVYDYKLYISMVLGYLGLAINVIFFEKFSTKKVISSAGYIGIIILDYILFCALQMLTYYVLCITTGDSGLFTYQIKENDVIKEITTNVQQFGMNGFVYNLLGFVILIVGGYVLRSQGVICNRKQKFIDDKENAELMAKDLNFRIEEADENAHVGDEDSQEKNDGEIH